MCAVIEVFMVFLRSFLVSFPFYNSVGFPSCVSGGSVCSEGLVSSLGALFGLNSCVGVYNRGFSFLSGLLFSCLRSSRLGDKPALDIINEFFEGYYEDLECNSGFFSGVVCGSLDFVGSVNFCGGYIVVSEFSFGGFEGFGRVFFCDSSIYGPGVVVFPLSFFGVCNVPNYVGAIYFYLYVRCCGFYKSSCVSLFYYFVGLFYSLSTLYSSKTIRVLYSNLSLIVSRLSSYVVVCRSFNGLFAEGTVINVKFMNIFNLSSVLSGYDSEEYKPYLIGVTRYTLISCGVFSSLSFQNTLQTLKRLVLEDNVEWKVDSKSNLISSGFIPVGSGWYRYFMV
ncbi:hypothetical protein BEWA_051120 (apicoplast) [Theileria equi strain WA]|uniref:Signal peptide-containing protein n=1 Tax=Theileria equi strain WA TaxID=1537102 RepID=L1L978_THEEQ|nr:hypothetical protein BEWA_051120 [Theileria equi strain WA]EKX71962.1 hypothetical protein BEWA_051120 [Theileria equi strain WA]|eukprot:XP_025033555.1 hypothetical protein BEWA_051120 (apicoplast) [Theileria equi strain WA]